MALYTLGGGIITALIAAVPGFIDWLSIEDRKLGQVGLIHMVLNLAAVALFAVDWWLRYSVRASDPIVFVLSLVGVALISISGWLGGTLVHRYRVSVEERGGAHPA